MPDSSPALSALIARGGVLQPGRRQISPLPSDSRGRRPTIVVTLLQLRLLDRFNLSEGNNGRRRLLPDELFEEALRVGNDHLLRFIGFTLPGFPICLGNPMEVIHIIKVDIVEVVQAGCDISRHSDIDKEDRSILTCLHRTSHHRNIDQVLPGAGRGDDDTSDEHTFQFAQLGDGWLLR